MEADPPDVLNEASRIAVGQSRAGCWFHRNFTPGCKAIAVVF